MGVNMKTDIRDMVINQLYGSDYNDVYMKESHKQAGELSHIKDALCTIAHGIDMILNKKESPSNGH